MSEATAESTREMFFRGSLFLFLLFLGTQGLFPRLYRLSSAQHVHTRNFRRPAAFSATCIAALIPLTRPWSVYSLEKQSFGFSCWTVAETDAADSQGLFSSSDPSALYIFALSLSLLLLPVFLRNSLSLLFCHGTSKCVWFPATQSSANRTTLW